MSKTTQEEKEREQDSIALLNEREKGIREDLLGIQADLSAISEFQKQNNEAAEVIISDQDKEKELINKLGINFVDERKKIVEEEIKELDEVNKILSGDIVKEKENLKELDQKEQDILAAGKAEGQERIEKLGQLLGRDDLNGLNQNQIDDLAQGFLNGVREKRDTVAKGIDEIAEGQEIIKGISDGLIDFVKQKEEGDLDKIKELLNSAKDITDSNNAKLLIQNLEEEARYYERANHNSPQLEEMMQEAKREERELERKKEDLKLKFIEKNQELQEIERQKLELEQDRIEQERERSLDRASQDRLSEKVSELGSRQKDILERNELLHDAVDSLKEKMNKTLAKDSKQQYKAISDFDEALKRTQQDNSALKARLDELEKDNKSLGQLLQDKEDINQYKDEQLSKYAREIEGLQSKNSRSLADELNDLKNTRDTSVQSENFAKEVSVQTDNSLPETIDKQKETIEKQDKTIEELKSQISQFEKQAEDKQVGKFVDSVISQAQGKFAQESFDKQQEEFLKREAALQKQLDEQQSKFSETIKDLTEQNHQLQNQNSTLKQQNEESQAGQSDSLKTQYEEIQKLNKELEKAKLENKTKDEHIESLKSTQKGSVANNTLEIEIKEFAAEREGFEVEKKKLQKQLGALEKQGEKDANQINELQSQLESKDNAQDKLTKENESLKESLAESEKKFETANKRNTTLEETLSTQKEQFEAKEQSLQGNVLKLTTDFKDLSSKYEQEQKENEDLTTKLSGATGKIDSLTEERDDINNIKTTLEREREKLEAEKQQFIKNESKLNQEKEQLTGRVGALEGQLESVQKVHSKELNDLVGKHEEQLAAKDSQHKGELQDKDTKHQTELDEQKRIEAQLKAELEQEKNTNINLQKDVEESKQQTTQLEQKNKLLETENLELKGDVAAKDSELGKVNEELAKVKGENKELTEQLDSTKKELGKVNEELAKVKEENKELSGKLDATQKELKDPKRFIEIKDHYINKLEKNQQAPQQQKEGDVVERETVKVSEPTQTRNFIRVYDHYINKSRPKHKASKDPVDLPKVTHSDSDDILKAFSAFKHEIQASLVLESAGMKDRFKDAKVPAGDVIDVINDKIATKLTEAQKKEIQDVTADGYQNIMQGFKDKFKTAEWKDNVTEIKDSNGKEVCTILSVERNAKIDGQDVTISNVEIGEVKGKMNLCIAATKLNGEAMDPDKEVFFTAHYDDKGKLVEMTMPKPIKFGGQDPDSPILFKQGDETCVLPINRGQYQEMQRELNKNKGIDVEVGKLKENIAARDKMTEGLNRDSDQIADKMIKKFTVEGKSSSNSPTVGGRSTSRSKDDFTMNYK